MKNTLSSEDDPYTDNASVIWENVAALLLSSLVIYIAFIFFFSPFSSFSLHVSMTSIIRRESVATNHLAGTTLILAPISFTFCQKKISPLFRKGLLPTQRQLWGAASGTRRGENNLIWCLSLHLEYKKNEENEITYKLTRRYASLTCISRLSCTTCITCITQKFFITREYLHYSNYFHHSWILALLELFWSLALPALLTSFSLLALIAYFAFLELFL